MKLMKVKAPRDSYVVASRNGVRISRPGNGPVGDDPEALGRESELEAFEAMRDSGVPPSPASNPEPG